MTAVHANAQHLDPREQHYWIEGPHRGMRLFLRHLPPAQWYDDVKPVLYVHGATFPSALSIAHRFDGYSWRDALCEAGFDVWAFDFQGYGYSDRYPAMSEPAQANPPLCRTEDASEQVEAVARFILRWHGVPTGHQPLLGFNAGCPFCRPASHNGRAPRVVRRNRSPSAAQIREAAYRARVAHRYGRRSMGALCRRRSAG